MTHTHPGTNFGAWFLEHMPERQGTHYEHSNLENISSRCVHGHVAPQIHSSGRSRLLLRGTIVNGTYGTHKNLYI